MKVSETTKKIYDGISSILKENGQPLSKAQEYAVESLVQTIEEATEKRCLDIANKIVAKKDLLLKKMASDEEPDHVSESTIRMVNEMVEERIQRLKREVPQMMDYARLKKLEGCVETIKECVGYRSDEQVEKVAKESAKMLHSTKTLIQTQAKQISEKTASLNENAKTIDGLKAKVKQMQESIEAKDRKIVESTKKNMELANDVQNLQKKVEQSKKINETLEEKRKNEALKFYLEEKVSKYPKYEADLLRKHFQGAKSKAEIDENFQKALSMVAEKRDAMRTVQAIPVAKVDETKKKISGETIVGESGGKSMDAEEQDDSFVAIDLDNDKISPEQMQKWMDLL